jgi:hypothetical protein
LEREKRHQDEGWWRRYGEAAMGCVEELDDVAHDLRLAARLHNRVLEREEEERQRKLVLVKRERLEAQMRETKALKEELQETLKRVSPCSYVILFPAICSNMLTIWEC